MLADCKSASPLMDDLAMSCTIRLRFTLGRLAITQGALDALTGEDIANAIKRHATGEWGELDKHDREMNDQALKKGGRILSQYRSEADEKFWVITEADRSATTILLPSEY